MRTKKQIRQLIPEEYRDLVDAVPRGFAHSGVISGLLFGAVSASALTYAMPRWLSLVLFSISISVAHAGDNSRAPWVGKQLDGKKCENNANVPGDGPYNYRDRPAIDGTLNMVNNAHFPEKVENLLEISRRNPRTLN